MDPLSRHKSNKVVLVESFDAECHGGSESLTKTLYVYWYACACAHAGEYALIEGIEPERLTSVRSRTFCDLFSLSKIDFRNAMKDEFPMVRVRAQLKHGQCSTSLSWRVEVLYHDQNKNGLNFTEFECGNNSKNSKTSNLLADQLILSLLCAQRKCFYPPLHTQSGKFS